MSELGQDFTGDSFKRMPIGLIQRLLAIIADEEQRRANINALTNAHIAQLICSLAHGFSGAKGPGPRIKTTDFLPFPDWKPKTEQGNNGPDYCTQYTLKTLAQKRLLPLHAFTSLITQSEVAR